MAAQLRTDTALAMGNTIILKPSEETSFSAIRLFELIHEADILP
ncbi:aldehyde dehydrogenase family protein, partial [Rhizobium ruizarguesonis]